MNQILDEFLKEFCRRIPRVILGFLGRISGEICGEIRKEGAGEIFKEISGKYLKYDKVNFFNELLKFIEELSKESLNYLTAKFPWEALKDFLDEFLEKLQKEILEEFLIKAWRNL